MAVYEGGPAFPELERLVNNGGAHTVQFDATNRGGMSLRDYFAGQAMTGMLASDAHPDVVLDGLMDSSEAIYSRASFAYKIADAMLAAKKGQ